MAFAFLIQWIGSKLLPTHFARIRTAQARWMIRFGGLGSSSRKWIDHKCSRVEQALHDYGRNIACWRGDPTDWFIRRYILQQLKWSWKLNKIGHAVGEKEKIGGWSYGNKLLNASTPPHSILSIITCCWHDARESVQVKKKNIESHGAGDGKSKKDIRMFCSATSLLVFAELFHMLVIAL